MIKKNGLMLGIGAVVLIIAIGIAYQNYADAKISKQQVDSLNVVLQQKNTEIAKLTKELKAKQDELSGAKTELDSTKKALDDAKALINKAVTEQPAI